MNSIKLFIILVAIFVGAYLLRGVGMSIENMMGLLVVGGGLLFFIDWCFKR